MAEQVDAAPASAGSPITSDVTQSAQVPESDVPAKPSDTEVEDTAMTGPCLQLRASY
jgi:hypothetical protein